MEKIYDKIREMSLKYEKEIANFLSRMIQTPSYSGKEKNMISLIKQEMEKVGFDEIKIDALGSIIG